MLPANTSEAAIAATPRVTPKTAERTGTAVEPRPGWKARRIPATAVGDRPARDSAAVNAEGRSEPGPRPPARVVAVRAAVQAGGAEARMVRNRTEIAPAKRAAASTANPGSGSAKLARPTGVRGESSTAVGTSTQAAATPMTPARSIPSQTSWRRDSPSAQRAGRSADS